MYLHKVGCITVGAKKPLFLGIEFVRVIPPESAAVAHGKGNRFSVHAGDDLPGHVPGLVVGILLAVACGLQEAGELAQRVIGIGALGGLAVFSAHLARDVAVLVVAVAEGNVACAAGGLGEQIANAVIAVCRCQGAGRGFNPPACRIIGIAGYVAIQPRDAGHAVHAVVGELVAWQRAPYP